MNENNGSEKIVYTSNDIFCTNCGKKIESDWTYCKYCGNPIDLVENSKEQKIDNNGGTKNGQNLDSSKNNKKIIIFIVIGFLIGIVGLAYYELYYNKVSIEDAKKSVVKIITYDDGNNELSTGSGFCALESNKIVTNFHVIEGASRIEIEADNQIKYDINRINVFMYDDDLAVISGDFNLVPLKLGNIEDEKIGNNVITIGSPKGQLNTISKGTISNNTGYEISTTASVSPGSSGGPLLNERGRVVGIIVATYNSLDAQNLNYAINVNYLKKMWESYNTDKCHTITNSDCSNYKIVSLFDYNAGFKSNYYSVSNMEVFKTLTSDDSMFADYLASKKNGSSLQGIYSTYSPSERYTIVQLYKEMKNHEKKEITDLSNTTVYDAIVNTEIIPYHEYAMKAYEYQNTENIENVISKYPMEKGEDIFWRCIYGNLKRLSSNQYDALSQFIFDSCPQENQAIWFDYFGYEIKYDSNGFVNEVFWYY